MPPPDLCIAIYDIAFQIKIHLLPTKNVYDYNSIKLTESKNTYKIWEIIFYSDNDKTVT
jgi:hypothetical protein